MSDIALTDKNGESVEIHQISPNDSPGISAFEIAYDNNRKLAGFSEYLDHVTDQGHERIFFHTQISDGYEGRGLAALMTKTALERSAADDYTVVALCPYVAKYLGSHPAPGPVRRPEPADIKLIQAALRGEY